MAKMSTCKCCGKKLLPEEKHTHSSKTYCIDCYNEIIEKNNQYKDLISYICEIFDIDAPTGLILKQIKDYVDTYHYGYTGIQYTLWYIKEILRRSFEVKYGIAQVKYQYENAEKYYIQQEKIENSIDTLEENKINVIKIKHINKPSKKILFDIDKLIGK